MKSLSLLASLCFLTIATAAHAQPGVQVGEIQLRNVSSARGRAVTVYFASGAPARFSIDGGIPVIRTLEAGPIDATVASDGSARIPPTFVPRVGFQILNYMVIIVHPSSQSRALIRNADGTMPTAQGLSAAAGTAPSEFGNDRVIYLRVRLDGNRRSVVRIGSTQVQGDKPVALDLGENP